MPNNWLGGENHQIGGGQRETRWLTPPHIVNSLGRFALDPCGAPGHELADRTYLLERGEDGLALPWDLPEGDRVWLNPPYGPAQRPFMERMVEHGVGTALIFARTETVDFHRLVWERATALLFLRGRISFISSTTGGVAKANAGAPSVLVAYGESDADILRKCSLQGAFVRLGAERKES